MDLRDAVTHDRPEAQDCWGGVEKTPIRPLLALQETCLLSPHMRSHPGTWQAGCQDPPQVVA